jgi:hypothetical protein
VKLNDPALIGPPEIIPLLAASDKPGRNDPGLPVMHDLADVTEIKAGHFLA